MVVDMHNLPLNSPMLYHCQQNCC